MDSVPIALYPFRYFDPRRRRWVVGRYRATVETLCEAYDCFQITGPPEVRERNGSTAGQVQRGPSA